MINSPIIKDDAFPASLFKKIQEVILDHRNMSWYYTTHTAYGADDVDIKDIYQGSFFHLFMDNQRHNSYLSQLLETAITFAAKDVGIDVKSVERIRGGFIPVTPHPVIHNPHVDMEANTQHTALLYINESDGDTVIYDETYDIDCGTPSYDHYKNIKDNIRIALTVSPKPNRLVIFDSNIYHASTSPTAHANRIVINFNFD